MGAGMSGMPLPRNAPSQMQFPAQQHPHMLQGERPAWHRPSTEGSWVLVCTHQALYSLSATPRLCKTLLLHETSGLACD